MIDDRGNKGCNVLERDRGTYFMIFAYYIKISLIYKEWRILTFLPFGGFEACWFDIMPLFERFVQGRREGDREGLR
jgi:hypothetical protein